MDTRREKHNLFENAVSKEPGPLSHVVHRKRQIPANRNEPATDKDTEYGIAYNLKEIYDL